MEQNPKRHTRGTKKSIPHRKEEKRTTRTRMGEKSQTVERNRRMEHFTEKLQTRNQMQINIDKIDKKTTKTQQQMLLLKYINAWKQMAAFRKTNKQHIQYAQNPDHAPQENKKKTKKNTQRIYRHDMKRRETTNLQLRNNNNKKTPPRH